jgi:hypothetical protein
VQMGGDVPEEIDEANDKDEVEGLFPEIREEGQDSWYQREECDNNKKIVNKAISGHEHNACLREDAPDRGLAGQSIRLFFTAKNTRPAVFFAPKRSISRSFIASTVLGLTSIF